jgi:hypothetical protein
MNPKTLAIVSLRALAQLFRLQGAGKRGDSLDLLADGIKSGADIDAHMQGVADALESGETADWDDLHARINAEADRLRNR